MKDNTLYLEIYKDQSVINISLHKSKAAIWTYKTVVLDHDKYTQQHIDKRCTQMIDALNRCTIKAEKKEDALNEIKSLGNILSDELLPATIKQKLIDSDATYLLLFIDDHLVHIPWELMCIGDQFLCERFCMGRIVKTRQDIIESEERPLHTPVKMWIVADPKNDLAFARQEGKYIRDYIDDINTENEKLVINAEFNTRVDSSELKEKIRHFDMIHYTGHSFYDPKAPENSGWKLTTNYFTAKEIVKMSGTQMPQFIFSNACQSARTDKWETDHLIEKGSYGLANSFMLSGVKHYIGTSWDINDGAGSEFTVEFYRQLFNGETIGRSMNEARKMLMDPDDFDICWASYVLYGDPRVRYFNAENDQPPPDGIKSYRKEKTIFKNHRFFPAKRGGKVGWNISNIKETRNWITLLLLWVAFFMTYSLGIRYIHVMENVEIQKILNERIMSMQKEVDELFQQLIHKMGPLDPPKCKRISVYFEKRTKDEDRKQIIKAIIGDEIDKKTGFKPLATELSTLRIIILNLLTQKPPIHYQLPQLMLFFDTYEMNSSSTCLLLMKLVDVESGRTIIEHFFENVDKKEFILRQRESITRRLIQVLNDKYPVKGKIIKITNHQIEANIGACDGVKNYNQNFNVENTQVLLTPLAIRSETCALTINNGSVMPNVGDKIRYVHQ